MMPCSLAISKCVVATLFRIPLVNALDVNTEMTLCWKILIRRFNDFFPQYERYHPYSFKDLIPLVLSA